MKYDQEELLEKLKYRLNELKINFEQFSKIIKEHNILLSGSFLLQIITDKIFDVYDIDLFIFGDRNLILENQRHNYSTKNPMCLSPSMM